MRPGYIDIDENINNRKNKYATMALIFVIITTVTFVLLITNDSSINSENLNASKDISKLYNTETSSSALRSSATSAKSLVYESQTVFKNEKKSFKDSTYSCTDEFAAAIPAILNTIVLSNPTMEKTYTNINMITADGAEYLLPVWCLNYFAEMQAEVAYNETTIYAWTDVVADPKLAGQIKSPQRLNQVAWVLNNIEEGDLAIGPQIWKGNKIDGCTAISASDIQATFWALVNIGKCDDFLDIQCTESLYSPNVCNIAYIYSQAFKSVPDGSTYIIPKTCNGNVIYPVIVVPNAYSQPLVVSATIEEWKYECKCPTPVPAPTAAPTIYSCTDEFAAEVPDILETIVLSNPTMEKTYTNINMITSDGAEYLLPVWCLNYFAEMQAEVAYNETTIYPWTQVIANPKLAGQIQSHERLNQVAWILNNIEEGDLAIGPQIWNGNKIDGCTTISASDIQATFWALVNIGKCDDFLDLQCTESLYTPNACNIAYIYSQAFKAVPDGSTYIVPGTCNGDVIYPVIVVPNAYSQPLVVSATIEEWKYECKCPTPVTSPTQAPQITAAPTSYSCANAFSYSIPSTFYALILDNPTMLRQYSNITLISDSGNEYRFPVWCVNYFKDISAQVYYNETLAYSWIEVILNPSLVPSIEYAAGLSQIAWILNNIQVGDTAIGPVTWQGVKFYGCTYISSSDIQATFWAIANKGKCDNPDTQECTESLYPVNLCNVGYIYNSAFKAVPPGVIYNIPDNCNGDVIVPIVVIAAETLQPLVVSATVAQWDYKCDCPHPVKAPTRAPQIQSCSETFIDSLPQILDTSVLSNPTLNSEYSNITLSNADGEEYILPVYCLNYFAEIQAEYYYNDSNIYSWIEVISNPKIAAQVTDPSLLNQIAWILNNIKVGDEATGPQYYNGQLNGCSTISSSDIQRTFWAIMNSDKCKSLSPDDCSVSLLTVNPCNVAYIYNSAFNAVPKGSTYIVPNTCSVDVVVPIIVVPNYYSQPFAIAATLAQWDYECPCAYSSKKSYLTKSVFGWLEGGPTESPTTIPYEITRKVKGRVEDDAPTTVPLNDIKKVKGWLEGGPTESPTFIPLGNAKKVSKWLEGGPTESPTTIPLGNSKKVSKWLEGGPTESPTTIPLGNTKKVSKWLEGGPTESPTSIPLGNAKKVSKWLEGGPTESPSTVPENKL